MKKEKAILLSYAAGIIDGEGSVTFHHDNSFLTRRNRKKTETWYPRITVKMNDGKVINFLFGLFGGRISIGRDLRKGIFPSFTWEIHCQKAAKIAKKLLPFLRTKKKQAELIIRFQLRVDVGKKKYIVGKYWHKGIPSYEVEKRRSLALELKRLNADNIHIPAGLTTEQVKRTKVLMRQSKLIGKKNNKIYEF